MLQVCFLYADFVYKHKLLYMYSVVPKLTLHLVCSLDALNQPSYYVLYREYNSQLCEYRGQCQEMLGEADRALRTLQTMKERHEFVSQRTGALHHACEQLMEDQVRIYSRKCIGWISCFFFCRQNSSM